MTEDQVLSVPNTGPGSQSSKDDESLGTPESQADPYETKKSGIITAASSADESESVTPPVNGNLMNGTASATMNGHLFQNGNVPPLPRSMAEVSLSVAALINGNSHLTVSCAGTRDQITSQSSTSTSVGVPGQSNSGLFRRDAEQIKETNQGTSSNTTPTKSAVEPSTNATTPTNAPFEPSATTSNATPTKSSFESPAKLSPASQTDAQPFKSPNTPQASSNHVASTGASPAVASPMNSVQGTTMGSSYATPSKQFHLNHATSTQSTPANATVNSLHGSPTSFHSTPTKSAVVTPEKHTAATPGSSSQTSPPKPSQAAATATKPSDGSSTSAQSNAPSSSYAMLTPSYAGTPTKSPVNPVHPTPQNTLPNSFLTPSKLFHPSLATSTHSTPGNQTVNSLHGSPISFHSTPPKSAVVTPERPSIAVTAQPQSSNVTATTSLIGALSQPSQSTSALQNHALVNNSPANTSLPINSSVPSTSSQSSLFHASTDFQTLLRSFQQPSIPPVSSIFTSGTMTQTPMSSVFDRSKDPLADIFRAHMLNQPTSSSTIQPKPIATVPHSVSSTIANNVTEDEPMEIDVETVDPEPVASSSAFVPNGHVVTTKEFAKTVTTAIVGESHKPRDVMSPASDIIVVDSPGPINNVVPATVASSSVATSSKSAEASAAPSLDKLHIASPAVSKPQSSKAAYSPRNANLTSPSSSKASKPQTSKNAFSPEQLRNANIAGPSSSNSLKPQASSSGISPNQFRNVQNAQPGSSKPQSSASVYAAYKKELNANISLPGSSKSPKPTSSKMAYSPKSPKPQTSASAYSPRRNANLGSPCSSKSMKPSSSKASPRSPVDNNDLDVKPRKIKRERPWDDTAPFKCPNTDAYLDSYQELPRSVKEGVEEFVFENHSLMVFRTSNDFMTYTQLHTERQDEIKIQKERMAEIEAQRQMSMRKDKAKVKNDALKERARERDRAQREQRKAERAQRRNYRREHNNGKSMTREERVQYLLERERRIQERNARRVSQTERRTERHQNQKERAKGSSNDSIPTPSSSLATTPGPSSSTPTSSTSLQSASTNQPSTSAFPLRPPTSGMNDQTIGMETLASFAATVQGQKRSAPMQSPAMPNGVVFSPPAKTARVDIQNVPEQPAQTANGVLKAPPKPPADKPETLNGPSQQNRPLPHPEASFAAAHPPRIPNGDLMAQQVQHVAKFMQMPPEPIQQIFGNQPEVAAAFAPAIAIADRVMKQPNPTSNNVYTDLMTSMAHTSASERAGFQKPPPPSSAVSASQPAVLPKRTVAESPANSLQPVSASSFSERSKTPATSAHKSLALTATKTVALDPSNKNLLLLSRGIQFPLDAALGSQLACAAFLAPEVLSRSEATDLPLRSAGKHHIIAKRIFEKPRSSTDTCESVDCEVVSPTKIINLGPTNNRTPMQSAASAMPPPIPPAQAARPNVAAAIANITTPRSQAAPLPPAAAPPGPSASQALNANAAAQPGPSSMPQMSAARPNGPQAQKPLPPNAMPPAATPQDQHFMAQLQALLSLPNRQQQQHIVMNQQNEHLRMMAQVNSALGLTGRGVPPARGAPTATDVMLFNEAQRMCSDSLNKDLAIATSRSQQMQQQQQLQQQQQQQQQQQPQRTATASTSAVPAPAAAMPSAADLQNQQLLMSLLSGASMPNANMMMFGGAPMNNPHSDPLMAAVAQLQQQNLFHALEVQRQQAMLQQQQQQQQQQQRVQEEMERQERQRQERAQEQQRAAELARKQEQDNQRQQQQQQANLRAELQRQQEELQRQQQAQQAAQQAQQHRPMMQPAAAPQFAAPRMPMFPGMANPYFRHPAAQNMNAQQQQMATLLASFEEMQRIQQQQQRAMNGGLPSTSQAQATTAQQQQADLLQQFLNPEFHREAMEAARLLGMQSNAGPRPNLPMPALNQNIFPRAPFGISGMGLPPNAPQNMFGKPPTFPNNNPNGNNRE